MYLTNGLMDFPSSGSTVEIDCNTDLVLLINIELVLSSFKLLSLKTY